MLRNIDESYDVASTIVHHGCSRNDYYCKSHLNYWLSMTVLHVRKKQKNNYISCVYLHRSLISPIFLFYKDINQHRVVSRSNGYASKTVKLMVFLCTSFVWNFCRKTNHHRVVSMSNCLASKKVKMVVLLCTNFVSERF